MRKIIATASALVMAVLALFAVSGPASATSAEKWPKHPAVAAECCSPSHIFHLVGDNGNAIDVTVYYDIKASGTSGYLEFGCNTTVVATNPSQKVDAVSGQIEGEPSEFVKAGPSLPCQLGGSASTHNDVANGGSVYQGAEPWTVFHNTSSPRLRVVVWGLSRAGDGARYSYYTLP